MHQSREKLINREMYEEHQDELRDNKLVSEEGSLGDAVGTQISKEDYLKLFVQYVSDMFNKERGKDDTKKASLGDIKSTQVETCLIIQKDVVENKAHIDRFNTVITGNVKALIPIQRERLSMECEGDQSKVRYRKGEKSYIKEKRIFGIMTNFQLGYIPSLNVYQTEDEENFMKDVYVFKSLIEDQGDSISFDYDSEMQRIDFLNDFSEESISEEMKDQKV